MKRLVMVCLLLLLANTVFAAELPKELKPRYDGLLKVVSKLDGKAYRTYFSDDYVMVDAGGKTSTRSESMKQVDDIFKTCKSAKCSFKVIKSTTNGDTISVNFDFKLSMTLTTGAPSSIHEIGTDTWKKIKGAWLIVKTVDTVMEMK